MEKNPEQLQVIQTPAGKTLEMEQSKETPQQMIEKQNPDEKRKAEQIFSTKSPEKQIKSSQQTKVGNKRKAGDKQQQKVPKKKKKVVISKATKDERNRRTLFIKNIPTKWTEDNVKTLSKDIKNVRSNAMKGFAHIVFENEKMAKKNLKLLKGKTIENRKLFVDYCRDKSLNKKPKNLEKQQSSADEFDPQTLYITGFSTTFSEEDLRKLFPKASYVTLIRRQKKSNLVGFAFAHFSTPELASKSREKMNGIFVDGKKLIVMMSKKHRKFPKKQNTATRKGEGLGAKKLKKQEEEKAKEEKEKEEGKEEEEKDDVADEGLIYKDDNDDDDVDDDDDYDYYYELLGLSDRGGYDFDNNEERNGSDDDSFLSSDNGESNDDEDDDHSMGLSDSDGNDCDSNEDLYGPDYGDDDDDDDDDDDYYY